MLVAVTAMEQWQRAFSGGRSCRRVSEDVTDEEERS